MNKCGFVLSSLALLLTFNRAAASDDSVRVEPTKAEAAESAAVNRRYQQDLIAALSASDQPRHWLFAAQLLLVLDGLDSDTGKTAVERNALLDRALEAAPNDTFVWWQAAQACPATRQRCREEEVFERLKQLEPDNAAVWTLIGDFEQDRSERQKPGAALVPSARESLANAARAKRFTIHMSESIEAWEDAATLVPAPPEMLLEAAEQDYFPASESGLRSTVALGYSMMFSLPKSYTAFLQACDPKNGHVEDAALRADCLAYAALMADEKSDLITHMMGTLIGHRLLRGTPAAASIEEAIRDREWLVNASMEDDFYNHFNDDAALSAYLKEWRQNGEMAAIRQRLIASGISPEPPQNFESDTLKRYQSEAQ